MDLAWLAFIAVLLFVVGLCALAYDTVRRRRQSRPFPFPDTPTTSLDGTAIQRLALAAAPQSAAPRRTFPLPNLKHHLIPITSAKHALTTLQGRLRSLPFSTHPRLSLLLALALVLVLGTALAAIVVRAGPSPAPPGSIVVAICNFGSPRASDPISEQFADYLLRSAAAGDLSQLVVRTSPNHPTTPEQAESLRQKLGADFLWWGDLGPSGSLTASLVLAPDFAVGQDDWQRFADPDLDALLLPQQSQVYLPSTLGTNPLVPLSLALASLKAGDYQASAKAASGAQATIEDGGGAGQVARITEAVARIALGDFATAGSLIGKVESSDSPPPEALVDRSLSRLTIGDYVGARSDADRVIGDRDASDKTLARVYLLRARSRAQSGELTQAITDLDQASRLDPTYLRVKLEKAQILYRQAQPDAARLELEALLRKAPSAAAAYRLLGLVRLMLGQPDQARGSLGVASEFYSKWIASLRAQEGQAQVTGDAARAQSATNGIVSLNKELAGVHLYMGLAWADSARKEGPETFIAGVWRKLRGEPTTYERALGEMQQASQLDPRRPDVPLQMASVYRQLGDPTGAAQAIQSAQALDPSTPEPYMALADLRESQGDSQGAAKALLDLLSHRPRVFEAYLRLYNLYMAQGDTNSATDTLRRALQVPSQTAQDHLWRGKFLKILGNKAAAESEFRAAAQDPELWEAHLQLAQLLQEEGQGPEALAEFREALAVQPNNPDALLNAGRLLVLAGQPDEAEKLFDRLTALAPDNVDGHIEYLQLLIGKGQVDKAVEQGKSAVQAADKRADAHFFLGVAYDAQRDWLHSAEQYKLATVRDPTDFQAFIRLAAALFHDDRYTESMTVSASTIKLRADDPQPYRWQAEAQLALGDANTALQSIGEALRLSPQYADALALASRAYALKGDENRAISYAKEAVQADSRNPVGLLALGEIYLARGRTDDALKAFGDALTLDPGFAAAITGQARCYAASGDRDKALKRFAAALAVDRRYAEAHLYAGNIYADTGLWDAALQSYQAAADIRPRWPVALYYLGRAYLQHKDLQDAQAAFARATQSSPNMVEAWFGLGIAERDQGQRQQAIAALSRATQLNGNYAEAWLYLGLTYEESGDHPQAATAFLHALNTTSDPNIYSQAEQGLARVR
jgi:tetratricopeptide (TPR) repeat protein